MAIAIDFEPFEYVLKEDRALPEEQRTVFMLCALDAKQRSKADDARLKMRQGTVVHCTAETNLQVLRAGLRGWRNLLDRRGAEVNFATLGNQVSIFGTKLDPPSDACLDRLHPDHRDELAEAILNHGRLTDEDTGN